MNQYEVGGAGYPKEGVQLAGERWLEIGNAVLSVDAAAPPMYQQLEVDPLAGA